MTQAAYEHNGRPCTSEAFYAIACDPARHVAIEACAGAGKTWVLVSRILRALLEGAAPDEILAITFTRKAAGEMRERLQEWLLKFSRAGDGESDTKWMARLATELHSRGVDPARASTLQEPLAALHRRVLESGQAVQIRTFHGWFITLLAHAPLAVLDALGLPLNYQLIEDEDEVIAETWRPFLGRVAGDESLHADYTALVQSVGRTSLHGALENALKRRLEFSLADAAGHVQDAVKPFGATHSQMADASEPSQWLFNHQPSCELLEQAASELQKMATSFAAKGKELEKALKERHWPKTLAALFTLKDGRHQARAFSKGKTSATIRAAQTEVEQVSQAQHQHEAWHYHHRMMRLSRALIACFADVKRERGWVDMNDVERAAHTLLADHAIAAAVQERLDWRVRHVLIDEFQDTNPMQWRALYAWLAAYAGAGGGPDTPRVFIVGDPKQSIYRFRGADPHVFAAAQNFVVQALEGERLACDHTRRNAPAVLKGVNDVMLAAQDREEFEGFRRHTTASKADGDVAALPLVPKREKEKRDPDAPMVWRDSLNQPREEPEETCRLIACRHAAAWVAERVGAGVAPKSIMVLARKREPLRVLHGELRAIGIAGELLDKQHLAEQPAVLDLLALADALVSPGNDLALARALKSPLFGLSDAHLSAIAQAVAARKQQTGAPVSWLAVLPTLVWSDVDVPDLCARLDQASHWLTQLPPHDALQAIYRQQDVLARFAAAAPVAERVHILRQLRALLAAALDVDGGRFLTAYGWLRTMRRQPIPMPKTSAGDSVSLLTVHSAKGLQADEVLLLDAATSTKPKAGPRVLVDWQADAEVPARLVFVAKDSDPPCDVVTLAEADAQAQAREELNALYVAMTRACTRLVMAGHEPWHAASDSWWQRLHAIATPLDTPAAGVAMAASADATFDLLEVPAVPDAPAVDPTSQNQPLVEPDSDGSRLGQAMHWLLERAQERVDGAWPEPVLQQAGRRFDLNATQLQRATRMAHDIRNGAAAWAWSATEIVEAFDEVELLHGGRRLRIDRLVRRRAHAQQPETWWVLDYKSAFTPESDAALREQVTGYRHAVAQRYPTAVVRGALLSGDGRLVEID